MTGRVGAERLVMAGSARPALSSGPLGSRGVAVPGPSDRERLMKSMSAVRWSTERSAKERDSADPRSLGVGRRAISGFMSRTAMGASAPATAEIEV